VSRSGRGALSTRLLYAFVVWCLGTAVTSLSFIVLSLLANRLRHHSLIILDGFKVESIATLLWLFAAVNTWGCIQKFRTESITTYTLTFGITLWEATKRVMMAKLTRLAYKIATQLHLVAEICTSRSSHSRRPVRKLLDTHTNMITAALECVLWRHEGGKNSSKFSIYNKTFWDNLVLVQTGVGFTTGAGIFSFHHRVQTGCGSHPSSS